MIKKIIRWTKLWWYSNTMYAILDSEDNSVTLGRNLYRFIDLIYNLDRAENIHIYGFKALYDEYAFCVNSKQLQEIKTQRAELQYNYKYKTIGFELLNPTVNRIFYDYNIPVDIKVKLTVRVYRNRLANELYFTFKRPRNERN